MTATGALAPHLLERRLLFVTGKGGVGKTTVAAALGWLGAAKGLRTLVCEVDAKGNLADSYECGVIGFRPRQVTDGLWAMAMDTEESLKEYLRLQMRVPLVARIGPLARSLDFVASAAPGVKEILTVGKLCYEVREGRWDLVVVDAPATGHVVGLLAAPQAIRELVKVGRVREQTEWIVQMLSDAETTGAVIVTAPEEMPVNEALELAGRIADETTVDLAAVVVNKVLPELFGRAEEEVFERLACSGRLEASLGPAAASVVSGARLAVRLRRTRAAHLGRLRGELPAGPELLYLPYLFTRDHGLRSTTTVAESLSAELGF